MELALDVDMGTGPEDERLRLIKEVDGLTALDEDMGMDPEDEGLRLVDEVDGSTALDEDRPLELPVLLELDEEELETGLGF